jgi:hypothetical protein
MRTTGLRRLPRMARRAGFAGAVMEACALAILAGCGSSGGFETTPPFEGEAGAGAGADATIDSSDGSLDDQAGPDAPGEEDDAGSLDGSNPPMNDAASLDGSNPPIDDAASLDGSNPVPADAGDGGKVDAGPVDSGGHDGAADAGSPIKLLATGSDLNIFGVTTDLPGIVIYGPCEFDSDGGSGAYCDVYAVPIDGSATPSYIGRSEGQAIEVLGQAVLFWDGPGLFVWTLASKNVVQLASSSPQWLAAVSADGSRVAYADNYVAATMQGDLYASNLDGTAKEPLLTAWNNRDCAVTCFYAGTALIAQHCDAPPTTDAGTSRPATLSVFGNGTSADRHDVATVRTSPNYIYWAVSDDDTELLAPTTAGDGEVFSLPEPALVLDIPGLENGFLTGAAPWISVVYQTTASGLDRWNPDAGAPLALLDAGVAGLQNVSSTGNTILYYSQMSATTHESDVWAASTSTPMSSIDLVSGSTGGFVTNFNGPSDFTADGTWALYLSSINDGFIGALGASHLRADGSPSPPLAINGDVEWVNAPVGAKVVFDACEPTSPPTCGYYYVIDLAATSPVAQALPYASWSIGFSPDGTILVSSVGGAIYANTAW